MQTTERLQVLARCRTDAGQKLVATARFVCRGLFRPGITNPRHKRHAVATTPNDLNIRALAENPVVGLCDFPKGLKGNIKIRRSSNT